MASLGLSQFIVEKGGEERSATGYTSSRVKGQPPFSISRARLMRERTGRRGCRESPLFGSFSTSRTTARGSEGKFQALRDLFRISG